MGLKPPALLLTRLAKQLDDGRWLFRHLDLSLARGELVSLQGESGSGKSTLLNLIAGIDHATEGQVQVAGESVDAANDDASARLRARQLGFVFQAFHLLPNLPVWRNIALPLLLNGHSLADARARVDAALGELRMTALAQADVTVLSGGEQQRVALLRALIHDPALVLADEPTGNLDPQTAEAALELLTDRVRRSGAALLMVTHSAQAASICDRHLVLAQGQLAEQ